jgi:hypothetical protein
MRRDRAEEPQDVCLMPLLLEITGVHQSTFGQLPRILQAASQQIRFAEARISSNVMAAPPLVQKG